MNFSSNDSFQGNSISLADQHFITFNDPTGETAIANLSGDVTIRWRNGFTIRIPGSKTRGLIRWLNTFEFGQSTRGLVFAAKQKTPGAPTPEAQPIRNAQETKD